MADSSSPPPDPGPRQLLGSAHPDDTGVADASLRAALAAAGDAADGSGRPPALAALQDARLLVPVVAVLGDVEQDEEGRTRDKSSDMAAVLMRGADGRLALLAFTGTDSMTAWDPQARPVPVTARVAAQAALQDGAAALVVDIAGPARLVVEGDDLSALAAGWRIARAGDRIGWIRPQSS